MPRVPFLNEKTARIPAKVVAFVKERRGGSLNDIDSLNIHSEAVARGWSTLFLDLANKCSIDFRTRELALLRIGILTRAGYEYHQHRRIALKGGVPEADIDALQEWQGYPGFSAQDRAVLDYTDAMTLNIQVSDSVFEPLRQFFNDQQIVELTANIAGYNMVARYMEALKLETPKG